MIVGDFNADGTYFDEDRSWPPVLERMPDWLKITPNHLNTTVATSHNTYDRILITSALAATEGEVFVVQDFIDLSDVWTQGCQMGYMRDSWCAAEVDWRQVMTRLSDHYPVETCMYPGSSSGPSPTPVWTPAPPTQLATPSPAPSPAPSPLPTPPTLAPMPSPDGGLSPG